MSLAIESNIKSKQTATMEAMGEDEWHLRNKMQDFRKTYTQAKAIAMKTYLMASHNLHHVFRQPLYRVPFLNFYGNSLWQQWNENNILPMVTELPSLHLLDAINVTFMSIIFLTAEDYIRTLFTRTKKARTKLIDIIKS